MNWSKYLTANECEKIETKYVYGGVARGRGNRYYGSFVRTKEKIIFTKIKKVYNDFIVNTESWSFFLRHAIFIEVRMVERYPYTDKIIPGDKFYHPKNVFPYTTL